jgi:stage V sporulation protein B
MSMLTVLNTTLEAFGKTQIPLISLMVGAVLKLLVTYEINKSGEFGLIGAPIGTLVFYFAGFLISLCFLLFIIKIKIKITAQILKILTASVISAAITKYLNVYLFSLSTLNCLCLILIFAFLYFSSLYLLGFFKDKRIRFASK